MTVPATTAQAALRASLVKRWAWHGLHVAVLAARLGAAVTGRRRSVDTVIYKVDRLGDWLLATPALRTLAERSRASGQTCVIWASRESRTIRACLPLPCPVEEIAFEPRGRGSRVARLLRVVGLLAKYRSTEFICLRHGPDPIRDFVLREIAADRLYALSWNPAPAPAGDVPHEIKRHAWILTAAGNAPRPPSDLLPILPAPEKDPGPLPSETIVIAPFSSSPLKDWKNEFWADVVESFQPSPIAWELWVGADQISRAEQLASRLRLRCRPCSAVVVRSGNFSELIRGLARARLVVSVDTLAAHLAASLDAPLIALLGGGQFGDFAPWSRSERQQWLSHPLPCFHCGWHCIRPQPDCLHLLTPSTVVDAMRRLRAGTASSHVPTSEGAVA